MAPKKKKTILFWLALAFTTTLVLYLIYPEKALSPQAKIDYIKVEKSKRKLYAFQNGKLLKTYQISLGGQPVGHKQFEGDKKTPQGIYIINAKNANSGYHKNLGVSYPNTNDLYFAKKAGRSAGGDVKLHGLRNGLGFLGKFQRLHDWTAGCIALTNHEIDELYGATAIGTKIEILP